jgi:3-hydroxyacyl-CoA dehydrogenase
MLFDGLPKRVAVVGTGVIGASWAAHFLARELDVVATDPAPNAERNLRQSVEAAWYASVCWALSRCIS